MGADVGAGLEEVEQALDLRFLSALDGENHAFAVTRSGGFSSFFDQGVFEKKDITGGVWEGVGHDGGRVSPSLGRCELIF